MPLGLWENFLSFVSLLVSRIPERAPGATSSARTRVGVGRGVRISALEEKEDRGKKEPVWAHTNYGGPWTRQKHIKESSREQN